MGLAEGIENKKILSDGGIPHFMYAEPAIKHSMRCMVIRLRWIEKEDIPPKKFVVDKEKQRYFNNMIQRLRTILEEEGYEILKRMDFLLQKTFLERMWKNRRKLPKKLVTRLL